MEEAQVIEFLQDNWLWILPILFVGLYFFLKGCEMDHQNTPKSSSGEEPKSGKKETLPLTYGTLLRKKEGEHHA